MPSKKIKTRLHSRNKNREKYDLDALSSATPELNKFIIANKFGGNTVDFSNPNAVKLLNKSILNYYYGIKNWNFSDANLCPPIPGRADYIHYLADLLSESNSGIIPKGSKTLCLDIGVGASCIYPVIGVSEYGWQFIGSDIDKSSITSAQLIIDTNEALIGKIELRIQKNKHNIFQNIINQEEKIDLTLCNPPFHSSLEDAKNGTRRKVKNLSGKNPKNPELNFAGITNELVYKGGEFKFIENMIYESKDFAKNCFWFTTLVSKQSNIIGIKELLISVKATQIKEIPMATGNKTSRIIAWTFLNKEEQKKWIESKK